MPLDVSCANDWRVWDLTKPAARPAARAPRASKSASSARGFYTYGLVTWPTPNWGSITLTSAPSGVPTAMSATKPAPRPFAARARPDPSEAVYVPATAAHLAPLAIAAAALLAGLIFSFGELIARLTAAPASPALSAALRAAAFFSDDLGFCAASCGDGVCGDDVCPRGEIESSRLLRQSSRRPIFLFSFFVFCAPRKVTHFFLALTGKRPRLRFLKPSLTSEEKVRFPGLYKLTRTGALFQNRRVLDLRLAIVSPFALCRFYRMSL
jgi:hypothetical protein